MSPCFFHCEIFFSSGPIWSDRMRFKFTLSPNTFEGKQDQARLQWEGETSSFAPSFPHLPWYPASPALTQIRYVTYLWRASSCGPHCHISTPIYSHCLGLWNHFKSLNNCVISQLLAFAHIHSSGCSTMVEALGNSYSSLMIWFKHLPMKSPLLCIVPRQRCLFLLLSQHYSVYIPFL